MAHSYPLAASCANEIVYFIITNVQHEVIPSNDTRSVSPDMYIGSTTGELGCWFDPSVTRMVQTGLEHSRVPDVSRYLGLGALILLPLYTTEILTLLQRAKYLSTALNSLLYADLTHRFTNCFCWRPPHSSATLWITICICLLCFRAPEA